VEGALICGSRLHIDYLINRARAFIFSTAPSPLMAVAVSAALDRIEEASDLRDRLKTLRQDAAEAICAPLGLPSPRSQIVPVILGEDSRTMAAAQALQDLGFDVRGIRPPTVPPGTSRLRISLTLNVGRADVSALGEALSRVMA
ncbi:MAG: aminotransferase class I/II-fold pyridoxal phosphate-dependent enzyme, partial [bacterium]|nr:aminotransferase class I/II-fold pyridoxal phosphate-dependent enzyme [bacterium]